MKNLNDLKLEISVRGWKNIFNVWLKAVFKRIYSHLCYNYDEHLLLCFYKFLRLIDILTWNPNIINDGM